MSGGDVAQTAPRLWAQLSDAGVRSPDLERLHAVHQVALRLFTGRNRECGKPFIDHLVGTASAVATVRLEPDLLGGALLHAVYTHNVFDDLHRGATRRRRRALTRLIGPGIEAHVHRYTIDPWSIERVHELLATPPADGDRDHVVLRIANEVDEQLDGCMRLDPRSGDALHDREGIAAQVALAHHFDLGPLARLLEETAARATALPSLPAALHAVPGDLGIALPPWARPTVRRRIRAAAGRARRRLRR